MGEFVATLALAQDNAFGQPLESQLRSCLLAAWLGDEAGFDPELRATVYWVALLRYVGCTGHAHEVASVFGDEIAIRARTLVQDAADPAEVMRDVVEFAVAGRPGETREEIIASIAAGGHEWAVYNFTTGCEVGDSLVRRLDLGPAVRNALRCTFERWNGTGYPGGLRGEAIPFAMRVVHLSHDMEAIARRISPADAVASARERRDRTYDPALADLFAAHGPSWLERLDKVDPWDAVLELEPEPHRTLEDAEIDAALLVAADFIDLKSPYMAGHSRRCMELGEQAGALLGLPEDALATLRRAALVHEFGTTAISNAILDKPGPLTRAERDRVELHPMHTEQMLRRCSALAALNPIAAAHHERADGSGYHRGLRADALDIGARVLAASDVYVGLTTERADRPARDGESAAAELRRLKADGRLDARAVDAVLAAAGHNERGTRKRLPTQHPAGLTNREVDVLRLAAQGLTTAEIAARLYISPKTADHHIQHVYTKIGVSTRGAAALWAIQHSLVG